MSDTQQHQPGQVEPSNLLAKLWNGDVGLAKMYWLWGVLAGLGWGIMLALITPAGSGSARLFVLVISAYFLFIYVGTWRAAGKYSGRKAWASLARFGVGMGAFVTAVQVAAVVIG